jgi:spore germination cell wall hydrolase CwlJ-like protein
MLDLPPPQIVCLAQAIYHEARGESDLGKRGVAHVILNRSKKFHKTPCEVLRQPGQFQIKLKSKYSGKAWKDAYQIAYYAGRDPTGGAVFFRHKKLTGSWGHKITTSIGNHNFYK